MQKDVVAENGFAIILHIVINRARDIKQKVGSVYDDIYIAQRGAVFPVLFTEG